MQYVELLKSDAQLDVDSWAERLADEERDLSARTEQQRTAIARARMTRSKARLADARRHRRATRKRLHLED